MVDREYPELNKVGTSYSIARPDLGVNIHITEPLINHDHNYETRFPGLKPPFGLSINQFPKYKTLLERDPTLIEAVNIMMSPPLAISTISTYSPSVRKIEEFCEIHGYPFPHISEPTILHYLAQGFYDKQSPSFYNILAPSVRALETVLSIEQSAITNTVAAAINSLKRKVAQTRKPVKKAFAFDFTVLSNLFQKIFTSSCEEIYKVRADEFRAIVRCAVIFYSFCRFSDYTLLRDTDLDDQGLHIVVHFARSKNDQYYEGSSSFIPARREADYCPVELLRKYYKRFGLHFRGSPTSGKFLNFRIGKQNGYHIALANTQLSHSTAVEQVRTMLSKYGFDGTKYTEKSFKVGGVTALCDSGEALENVMIAGRWRNTFTPMHYRNTSENFCLDIVKNLPHI